MRRHLVPAAERTLPPGTIPTISLVIPAYQAADHIGRALDSIVSQTVQPFEIIVSDDGSTDDLPEALRPYGARITVVHGPNGGLPVARNRGFRAAQGDFVANLDADDVLYPRWIEAVGELAASRPDLDIVTTNGYRILANGRRRRIYPDERVFPIERQDREIVRNNFITAFAAVRRTTFLAAGGFDEEIASAWDLWLRLIVAGGRAGCVDEPLFEYRMREGSLSSAPGSARTTAQRVLEKALLLDLPADVREEVAVALDAERRKRELETLRAELLARTRGARGRALGMAARHDHALAQRIKLLAAAVAPKLAARALRLVDRVAGARR